MKTIKFWTVDNNMFSGTEKNFTNSDLGILRTIEAEEETIETFWPWSAIKRAEVRTPKSV